MECPSCVFASCCVTLHGTRLDVIACIAHVNGLCCQELERWGVADTSKIAVGGHSYGAFMAANLLAHAPDLFACGIARSGAYNR